MSVDTENPAFRSMFREYDVRGRVSDEELNVASVRLIVAAYAELVAARGIRRAVVGYDNRTISPAFAEAACEALVEADFEVFFLGLAISPYVYAAQYFCESEGAVMITASHNPDGWSGFKFGKGYSKTLESADIRELFERVQRRGAEAGDSSTCDSATGGSTSIPGNRVDVDLRERYISEIVSRIHMGPHPPRVVIDAGNGGAGLFAWEVFFRLGCPTFQLNCDPDTSYPHYFPNPSNLVARTALRSMVLHPAIHAEIGIGYDGDGDRLGVIDEKGADVYSDLVLAVLAKQLLERKPGATVVFDVKCSQALAEVITADGGVPEMYKTGHSYIKAHMHEIAADLAGERSGHLFIGGDDYFGFDDAVFASAKLVEYLSHKEKPLSAVIASMPQYVTSPEIKAECSDVEKYRIVEDVTALFKERYPGRVNDINGARVRFEHGWGLVRASSNLPELVLIFEADTEEHLREIYATFREVLSAYDAVDTAWGNDPYL
ncbi:MAG: phosphomannomutase/phosphoglucomutase [Coriobacteriales bacterium]|jgi:phosphomannomutase/phosphoglucomutase|nr:phosphomannomutase/phosphoglucomutase [Coriobacteriales bacterium]